MSILNGSNGVSNFSGNSSSSSANSSPYQIWTFLPSFSLVVLIASVLLNGRVLALFAQHERLYTPFNVYLINLLSADVGKILLQVPIFLVTKLRPYWWIGRPACTVYLYGYFIEAGMSNAHALISMNRLWAVLYPTSYRRLHTKRVAWSLCAGMWLYVHAVKLPGFLRDALYFRLPEEKVGCFVNREPQMDWAYVQQFALFNLPMVLMIVAYPVIAYKVWKRRKYLRTIDTAAGVAGAVAPRAPRIPPIPITGMITPGKRQTNAFLVLTCSTVSLLVFWLPSIVYYTTTLFAAVHWEAFQQAATVLWFLEPVLDPILFTLAVADLRAAVRSWLRL